MMSGYIDNARKNGMGKLPAFFATRAITSGIITKKKVMREVNAAIDLFVPEHHLHQTGAVAQVDEDDATVVAAAGYPAAEDDLSADVGFTQHAAVMRALHTF